MPIDKPPNPTGSSKTRLITIGELASRTGVAHSAIRFHERKGLLHPVRDNSGQRLFARSDIRRLSFIRIAQNLGFSLQEIGAQLDLLPLERTPTRADWSRISQNFRKDIDARINRLTNLRDRLDRCIGCGCLSLDLCALYNPDDRAADRGSGAHYLDGSSPVEKQGRSSQPISDRTRHGR